jgi:hypothetical protein
MPYFLVILRAGGNAEDEQLHAPAHERFISSLIKRNVVLLGGERLPRRSTTHMPPISSGVAALMRRAG